MFLENKRGLKVRKQSLSTFELNSCIQSQLMSFNKTHISYFLSTLSFVPFIALKAAALPLVKYECTVSHGFEFGRQCKQSLFTAKQRERILSCLKFRW